MVFFPEFFLLQPLRWCDADDRSCQKMMGAFESLNKLYISRRINVRERTQRHIGSSCSAEFRAVFFHILYMGERTNRRRDGLTRRRTYVHKKVGSISNYLRNNPVSPNRLFQILSANWLERTLPNIRDSNIMYFPLTSLPSQIEARINCFEGSHFERSRYYL